jgi:4-hydroxybenzoyl-CoA thioesterase
VRHQLSRRVYVGDDDASGLIYFPSYLRYMAEGDQDYFDALGHPVVEMIGDGVSCPAVNSSCDFVSPARAGDDLDQEIRITVGQRSSFACHHEFRLDDRVVARGRVVRVWVNLADMSSQPLPEWLREASEPESATASPDGGPKGSDS